ncbi:MAG: serine/threonine protein kinase, partial [Anaerolineae bacterium]|nr:serine/threonine protein kinase [Anaerolineae bacterium]
MALDLVGKTLGGYRLDRLIGEGGMASVYKGYQESLKRWVAVKVLYYQEATSLARFQLEAKAIASLRHRNILIIYEYGDEEGMPYIAMEYIEGGTLEDRLNGMPLGWRQVVNLSIPIAEALHYAHNHKIIHRDVKPSNILMPQDDWPLLADF